VALAVEIANDAESEDLDEIQDEVAADLHQLLLVLRLQYDLDTKRVLTKNRCCCLELHKKRRNGAMFVLTPLNWISAALSGCRLKTDLCFVKWPWPTQTRDYHCRRQYHSRVQPKHAHVSDYVKVRVFKGFNICIFNVATLY
jgi:hypothetical protein